jgi:NADH:ubiquinone oxidoreductase subunit H
MVFIFNVILFLILTVIVAIITLVERKILSLIQRRVGPNYIGYKGRFQFIADALKLLLKHIFIITKINKFLFIIFPCLVLIMCYLFWINLIWGPNLSFFEIEYNVIFMSISSILFTFLLFLVGWASKNKYSILASNRIIIISFNLEIFLNFLFIFLITLFESFSFYQISSLQSFTLNGFFMCLPIMPLMVVTFLIETGRIPFDLGEAESELVAGHTTELGGFFFALFYLGEYFHLYCFSITYTLIFFNGWN